MARMYVYDGPKSEAVFVRNTTKATIRIGVPYRDVAGEIVRESGVTVQQDIILGSVLDEEVDGTEVRPGVLVAKTDWERLLKRPTIQSMIKTRQIEHYAAPL